MKELTVEELKSRLHDSISSNQELEHRVRALTAERADLFKKLDKIIEVNRAVSLRDRMSTTQAEVTMVAYERLLWRTNVLKSVLKTLSEVRKGSHARKIATDALEHLDKIENSAKNKARVDHSVKLLEQVLESGDKPLSEQLRQQVNHLVLQHYKDS